MARPVYKCWNEQHGIRASQSGLLYMRSHFSKSNRVLTIKQNYLQMILPCFAEAGCRLKQIKRTNIRRLIVPLKIIHIYLQYRAFCKENNIQTKRSERRKFFCPAGIFQIPPSCVNKRSTMFHHYEPNPVRKQWLDISNMSSTLLVLFATTRVLMVH